MKKFIHTLPLMVLLLVTMIGNCQKDIYNVRYQTVLNANANPPTYNTTENFIVGDITSDYGRREHPGATKWHRGIDYNLNNTDVEDHVLSVNDAFVQKIYISDTYKVLITAGDHHFGYGHIFENGTPPGIGMTRGDMVLKKMEGANVGYAIINLATMTAIGRTAGLTNPVVEYPEGSGEFITVTDEVNQDDPIAIIGNSGTNNVHLHLYMFYDVWIAIQDIGQNDGGHNNITNARDPMSVISHPNTEYEVSIETNDLELNNQNFIDDNDIVVFPGDDEISLMVRYNMIGATASGSRFTNAVMDIDDVGLYIKPDHLETDVAQNWGNSGSSCQLIMGKFVKSFLSHGARMNSEIQPITANATYGFPSNPENNTAINIGNNSSANHGSTTTTGIDPYAYRDGNNQPYDDYYFSDFYTRVHEDYELGGIHEFADANEDAKYKDGKYQLFAKVTTVRDDVYTSSDGGAVPSEIIIDNFKPFIQKVEIYKEGASQPEYSREWIWANGQYELEPIPPGLNFDVNEGISVVITTSEAMVNIELSLNGYANNNTEPENEERTIWNFDVADQYVIEGSNQLIIDGKDLATNDIQNFTNSTAVVPIRTGPASWNPPATNGADNWHSFTANASVAPPEIDFVADNKLPDLSEWVYFTSLPELENYQYTWVFTYASSGFFYYNEGTNENSPNPVVSFSGPPGKVNVSLTVTNENHTVTKTKENYITVVNYSQNPAIPEFATLTGVTNFSAGSYVDFVDLSENDPYEWFWTFEGANQLHSSLQNPVGIQYPSPGFYDVSLQVWNGIGSVLTLTKESYIAVYEVLPILEMDCWVNHHILYLNENVTVNASVYGGTPPYVYTFNFNNEKVTEFSSSMTIEQASHAFTTPGNKTITVMISDNSSPVRHASCNDYVTVEQTGPVHTVNFTWEPENPMLGQEITFTNLTTAPSGVVLNYSHWLWEADVVLGHQPILPPYAPYPEYINYPNPLASPTTKAIYNELGSYPVTLTVSDMNGWMVSKTKYINFSESIRCAYLDSPGLSLTPIVPINEDILFWGNAGCCENLSCANYDYLREITDIRWTIVDATTGVYLNNTIMHKSNPNTCYEMSPGGGGYGLGWFYSDEMNRSYIFSGNLSAGEYFVQCEIWCRCNDEDIYNASNLQPEMYLSLPYYDVKSRHFKVVDCDEVISFSLTVSGNHPEIWAGTINLNGQVQSGGQLHCVGHEEINMFPGFTAYQGSDFNAKIIPCPDCKDSLNSWPDIFSKVKGEDIDLVNIKYLRKSPLEIYPNPTSGMVNIVLHERHEYMAINVKQMNGGSITTQRYDYPDNIILDLSPYPKGIYLLTITTKDKVIIEKVVLQ